MDRQLDNPTHLNNGHRRRREFPKSYSAAPFIVYRSAKYSGLKERAFGYLANAKVYLKHPTLVKWISTFSALLYDITLIAIFIGSFPILLVSFFALYFTRRLRIFLVRRYYPQASVCDDFNPMSCQNSTSSDLATSVMWVKGHLDTVAMRATLESRISSSENRLSHLGWSLCNRFGVLVWETNSHAFSIENHVISAPKKFFGSLITDEPSRDLSGSSVLQKYIGSLVSTPFDAKLPPWQITVIPLPYTGCWKSNPSKPMSVVVLRFHRLLLKEKDVVKMFLSSLGQHGTLELEQGQNHSVNCEWIQQLNCGSSIADSVDGELVDGNCVLEPVPSVLMLTKLTSNIVLDRTNRLQEWLAKNQQSIESWIALRKKQYEFHSKIALTKSILSEFLDYAHKIPNLLMWAALDAKDCFLEIIQILRGIFYIPNILVKIMLQRRTQGPLAEIGSGFQKTDNKSKRHISWSRQISPELISEICNKINKDNFSPQNVFVLAVSLALQDYYHENCIPNPKEVGVTIASSNQHSGQKTINLSTSIYNIPQNLKKLETNVESIAEWKQRGLSYLMRFSSLFMPRYIANLVITKFFARYPIHFSFVDTESLFPHMTLWGHSIEEFISWKSPQSDFCISITVVKYAGGLRLSIYSPMKAVDTFISQRFCQYLNQIAESVGVEKSRIPYSRKSSPHSSNGTSPNESRKSLKTLGTVGFQFSPTFSNPIVPSKYSRGYKSSQSLLT